jgi:LytR cell envelope-related transcriptional attenuator
MIKSKKASKDSKSEGKSTKNKDVKVEPHTQAPKPFFLITIIGIVVIAAVVILAKNFLTNENSDQPASQPQAEQLAEVEGETDLEKLVNRVATLIEINRSEEPTIATVQDPALLKTGQPEFYKEAEVGDRLLVWSDKAVLYSTSKDKLLSVMMIAEPEDAIIDEEPAITSTIEDEAPTINVKNGTLTGGVAGKMKTLLVGEDIPVASIGDAKLKSYEKTVIIQLTDKEMPATLKALKDTTGAEVTEPVDGETGLLGDFIVIVGSDFNQ